MKTPHLFRHVARAGLCSIIIACFSVVALRAQTTLAAGDIAFTGYNSFESSSATYRNEFSFVVLRAGGLAAGTTVNFTDNGWNVATSGTPAFTSNEGVITWTADTAMPVWTQVSIRVNAAGTAILTAAPGSAVLTVPNFILSPAGDQVFAYQGTLASAPVLISGIHTNTENADGISSLSTWDAGYATSNESRSGIPPGLTGQTNAVMLVTGAGPVFDPATDKKANWKYNCTGAVGTTVAAVRTAINNRMNWDGANALPYDLNALCAFAALPVITVAPVRTNACITMDTVIKVNANYAAAYQWQKKTGTIFQDLVDTFPYSGSQTARLHVNPTNSIFGFYRVKVTSAAGTVTTDSVLLTISEKGKWLFTTTDWSDPNNWACGFIPDSTINVYIAGGSTSLSPIVNVPNAICNNVFIGGFTSLAFANAASVLEVKGTITVERSSLFFNGYFNTNQGKLIYSGGSQQTILAPYTYNNLEIRGEKTLPATFGSNLTIMGMLTLNSGKLFIGSNAVTVRPEGSITVAGTNAFIIGSITGTRGRIVQEGIGTGGRTGDVLFPMGTSGNSYTPLTVNNSGPATTFYLEMRDSIYASYNGSFPTGLALTNNAVNKDWNLFAFPPVAATVTLQWNSTDELAGFDNQNCAVARYAGSTWEAGPIGAATGSGPFSITRTGLTAFNTPMGVGSAGSPLPLDLITFSGVYEKGSVLLHWETANEKNTDRFELQQGTDGKDFTVLSVLPARGGAVNRYAYRHLQPAAGLNYYRLKLIDADGKSRLSKIVFVVNNPQSTGDNYTVYPNPAGEQLIIWSNTADKKHVHCALYDIIGRKMKGHILVDRETKLSLTGLPAGLYLLKIYDGNTVNLHKIEKR